MWRVCIPVHPSVFCPLPVDCLLQNVGYHMKHRGLQDLQKHTASLTHDTPHPPAWARQDLPFDLHWDGYAEMKHSNRESLKTEAVLSLSWSPYGRLPTELHRMRAPNCLRNKSSAFIARGQTTWPMLSDPFRGLLEDYFPCLHACLCTKGSKFCQSIEHNLWLCWFV